ncbi:molybdopterin-dependent oxidoreductase [Paenibacillus sp. RC67]|uniref:molybdopterin-dependent oxidoreductase n=1 Tax=Paenibacillus sp. RC67 TaxID=3039392 RepID=UPI0024ADA40A|nr:molybdopterin-dependent oxidoreductase [Paenibacillus sp. RC67]
MDAWRSWLKESYGKTLKRLHAWNAWLIVLLAITGVVLYVPSIRGDLGAFRVFLKQAHSVLGIASILVIASYIRYIPKHWKQIRQKVNQRWNLVIVLLLLTGWSVSGIILWQFRSFSPVWSNAALVLHDLFTWVGIPYAVYHSVSRSRWLKVMRRKEEREASVLRGRDMAATIGVGMQDEDESSPQTQIQYWKKAPISRAAFIRWVVGLAIVFGVGPAFYRWIKSATDTGGAELEKLVGEDANRMVPAPEALPESNPPAGGGGQGQFRVYTVTDIPAFASDNWKFTIGGLVEKPLSWSWEEFLKLKRQVQVSDFHCVTGWSVYKVTWEGIPLSELLAMANVKSTGRFVKMYSGDKVYTDCLSLEQAHMEDVMVAVLMDGKPIPQKLGGPVRLVVPKMYAYKSVKWLQAIELIDKEHIGYWEVRGYDNDAWVSKNRLS